MRRRLARGGRVRLAGAQSKINVKEIVMATSKKAKFHSARNASGRFISAAALKRGRQPRNKAGQFVPASRQRGGASRKK